MKSYYERLSEYDEHCDSDEARKIAEEICISCGGVRAWDDEDNICTDCYIEKHKDEWKEHKDENPND